MSERAGVPLGATAEPVVRYRVTGMDCAHDAAEIQQAARAVAGVETVKVSVATQIMTAHVTDAVAARGLRNVRPVRAALDALDVALPDAGTYDRAFLVTVLGDVRDRAAAMRGLYTALRPGGLLAVAEALPDPDYQSRRTVRRLAEQARFEFSRARGNWLAFTMVFRKPG